MKRRQSRATLASFQPPQPLSCTLFLVLALLAALPLSAQEKTAEEQLFQAAQHEQIAAVKQLIEGGVDVNARTRYGGTALAFAVDKGNAELTRLLIDAGADVNAKDDFYGFTPITMAMMRATRSVKHRDAMEVLLGAGVEDSGAALAYAVQTKNKSLVELILAKSLPDSQALVDALKAARAGNNKEITEIAALIEEHAGEVPEAATIELAPEKLEMYLGQYRNEDIGMTITVTRNDNGLVAQATGQSSFPLVATSETEFEAPQVPGGLKMTFSGRAGTIERFQLEQGNASFSFGRIDGSAMPLTSGADPEPAAATTAAADLPEAKRLPAQNWPGFRGPGASGIADGQGAPSQWDGESGKNIAWKTRVPGLALSSPVIWGNRVFVTSAVGQKADSTFRTGLYGDVDSVDDASVHAWRVFALDLHSGEMVWERTASEGPPKVKRHLKSSHANPTPATDGERLVVSFGSEGLFCYDFQGNLLWKKDLGVLNSGWFYDPSYEWGFSSSPILHDGKVITQVDIQEQSFLAAFDVETGEELWRTDRDEIPTWGTPSLLPDHDRTGIDEIITNGPTIRAYNAETGEELWTLGPNSEVTVATPVIADGLAYITANYPPARPIYVVRPGGRGDLSLEDGQTSSEHIVWSKQRGGVYIPTPLVYQGRYYALQMNGRLTVYDSKTGELIYRQRVGRADSFSGSGIAADGKLYYTTETGTTYVVKAGPEYALLATNELGEVVMSTPAISDGVLVVRGLKHVYGISQKNSE